MTQAETRGGARSEVLQHHVGAADETVEDFRCVRVFQIKRDAALTAVQPNEEAGLTMHETVVSAGEVTLAGALDLDDIGAQVGEMAGAYRRRHSMFERDDADAFEGSHDEAAFLMLGQAGKRRQAPVSKRDAGGGRERWSNSRRRGEDGVACGCTIARHEWADRGARFAQYGERRGDVP